jgi:hypothetical protein
LRKIHLLKREPKEKLFFFSKFGNKTQDAQKQAQALRANFSHAQGKPNSWTENLGKVTDFLSLERS